MVELKSVVLLGPKSEFRFSGRLEVTDFELSNESYQRLFDFFQMKC